MPAKKGGSRRKNPMVRKRLSKPTVSLVRAVAKRVVSDALEDKYARTDINPGGQPLLINSTISSLVTDVFPILPFVVQGTDSFQRIGDKITPKSLVLKLYVVANGAVTSSFLNRVRVFILEDRTLKNYNDLLAVGTGSPIGSQLLDAGNALQGYGGIPHDNYIRVNRRRYKTIKDVGFTLMKGAGTTAQSAVPGTQTSMIGSQYHQMTFRIPTPKRLLYVNPSDTYPSNFAPFFCMGWTHPDNGATASDTPLKVLAYYNVEMDYEDA